MSQVEDESATNSSSEAISFENYAADFMSKLPSRGVVTADGTLQELLVLSKHH
jgi:hypothetical protein